MSSATVNGRVVFKSIPKGYPESGKTLVYDTTEIIQLDTVPLNGGVLIKVLEVSADPYMRGRMREPHIESYSPPFIINKPIDGFAVGVVLRSDNSEFKKGDHVYGLLDYQEYIVKADMSGLRKIEKEVNLHWSTYLGVLGMPGKTAYMAWKEYSHAKKGETAFVTAGAGPVGSLVIQLAKQDGLKVIASAGSEEKVNFMKEIGADCVFNYKTTNAADILQKEGPIDIYWDNVGGTMLEAALEAASINSRFIECGMISGYNTDGQPIRNLFHVVSKSITMQGFIVNRIQTKYEEEFYAEMIPKVASRQIKHREQIYKGLDNVGDAIIDIQRGKNKAKVVVQVAED